MSIHEYEDNRTEVEIARDDATQHYDEYHGEKKKRLDHSEEKLPRAENMLHAADTIESGLDFLFSSGEGDDGYPNVDALRTLFGGNRNEGIRPDHEGRARAQRTIKEFRDLLKDVQLHAARSVIHNTQEIPRHAGEAERVAKVAGEAVTHNLANTVEAAKEDMQTSSGRTFNDGSEPKIYPENQ